MSRAYALTSLLPLPLSLLRNDSEINMATTRSDRTRSSSYISQKRLGSAFFVYDFVLTCWLVRCSVTSAQVSGNGDVTTRLPFTAYVALTFVQSGLMLLTAPLFLLANLATLVDLVRNVYLVILIIRGLFLTPLLLFSFSMDGDLRWGLILSGGNSILTVILMCILWIWATTGPNAATERRNRANQILRQHTHENIFVLIQREAIENDLETRREIEKFSGEPPKYEELVKLETRGLSKKRCKCEEQPNEDDEAEEPPPDYEEAVSFIANKQRKT